MAHLLDDDPKLRIETEVRLERIKELNWELEVGKKIRNLPALQHSRNTELSYRAAIDHYRNVGHCYLPVIIEQLAHYLTICAETTSVPTLRVRLSAISAWHRKMGFDDPTRNTKIRNLIRDLAMISEKKKKATSPLKFEELQTIVDHLDSVIFQLKKETARSPSQDSKLLRCYRDKSLILFGFWRGFLNHQLSGLVVEQLNIVPNQGMTILAHDPSSQSLRDFFTPFLKHYCPVKALQDWLSIGEISHGPIFRGIDRWGTIDSASLNSRSITLIVRSWIEEVGLNVDFTGHSLRRGFASWAVKMGWDIKSILEYVGWAQLSQHHDALVKSTPSLQAFLTCDIDILE
ncbi:tyrosine-type recombinase/integrase [Pseudomonas sp. PCH199]|uniref:tyrosine-type recombinase/integrase n=1 Tax=unclassified Pseudomonas TaxID=196821 RepID=UPI000BDADE1E|nr:MULTISPECIES: tyrosine-type recombinase/integrase [unclassified Pseudomonas]MCW8277246.1 tyrosine-type recombinase/integrase [Pseudomonas sp. PCH199]PAM82461.1 hypothetical protein CES87_17950 [Pseudomonas sp. ERMR1:02]